MKLVSEIAIYLLVIGGLFSCTRDMVSREVNLCDERVTYLDNMRPIIDASCAYSGCHVGGTAPGDFTNYEGLSNFFDGGLIEQRVTVAQNMPPSNAPGPTELSDRELELFKCWIEDGYPEN